MRLAYLAAGLMMGLFAGQAGAVALSECTRTTHVSHGGEADHIDLGEGRVMWRDWWSNEGTSDTLVVAECNSGAALRFLTAEINMSDRLPLRQTARAGKIVADAHKAARVFVTLPRLAGAVADVARDIEITTLDAEPCACAAVYADLRGDKTPFEWMDKGAQP